MIYCKLDKTAWLKICFQGPRRIDGAMPRKVCNAIEQLYKTSSGCHAYSSLWKMWKIENIVSWIHFWCSFCAENPWLAFSAFCNPLPHFVIFCRVPYSVFRCRNSSLVSLASASAFSWKRNISLQNYSMTRQRGCGPKMICHNHLVLRSMI